AMLGWPLHEIDVDVPRRAACETQRGIDAGVDIDAELAAIRLDGHDIVDVANQPAQVVERMTEREQYAAAKIRPRGIAGAIVLPGMHAGQVLAPVRLCRENAADFTRTDPGARLAKTGVEAELETDQRGEAARLGDLLQFADADQIVRHRLLDQKVRA